MLGKHSSTKPCLQFWVLKQFCFLFLLLLLFFNVQVVCEHSTSKFPASSLPPLSIFLTPKYENLLMFKVYILFIFLCLGKQNLEPVFETLGDPVLVCLLLLWSKHSNQRQLSREKGLSGSHFQELWPSLASAQLSWLLRTSCLRIVLPSACGPLLYQLAIRKILHRCVHGPIWSRQPHPKVLLGLCQAGIH